jgi:pseudaminic acid synthase
MEEIRKILIKNRTVGPSTPVYIIAELSANHNQDFNRALKLIKAAKKAGADAVKLQTYTPDTITIDCDNGYFRIGKGNLWEGKNLYRLYGEAFTPWEWQPELKKAAEDLGIDLFSTPFDRTAVDFLEDMEVPAYKIASFELIDLPLIEYVAKTGKPVLLSTGMATEQEIKEAIDTVQKTGNDQVALLKCTSAYPAPPEEMNLRTIPDLIKKFNIPVGLSDHTLGWVAPVAAVSLGACIIEKHFTLSRADPGPDSVVSAEPPEFSEMVRAVRSTELALGTVRYGVMKHEEANVIFRRSLFVTRDIAAGEEFSVENVRSIRPMYGLSPKYLSKVIGKKARKPVLKGTPLDWDLIDDGSGESP